MVACEDDGQGIVVPWVAIQPQGSLVGAVVVVGAVVDADADGWVTVVVLCHPSVLILLFDGR